MNAPDDKPRGDEIRLVHDVFLSDVFGIRWMRAEPQLSETNFPGLPSALAFEPRGTKVDVHVDAADFRLMARLTSDGWRLVNTKLTFLYTERDVLPSSREPESVRIGPLETRHANEMVASAGSLFVMDRFRREEDLDPARVPDLYRKWMTNNIEGRCREVMTANEGDNLLGFLCVMVSGREQFFDLIGVFEAGRHRGTGQLLVDAALRRHPMRPVRVVTQFHNIPMQRVLVASGFMPVGATSVLSKRL